MPLYYVYCAEYPDEGSEVVRADTVGEARAAGWDRSEESDRVEDARWMAWALYARRPKDGGGEE